MLILDLDDTIFKTSSMNPRIFDSAINIIKDHFDQDSQYQTDSIIKELWTQPIDVVLDKYATPLEVQNEFYRKIKELDYAELEIKPFEDYAFIRNINRDKILVTTGLLELQTVKIDALGIRQDFKAVYIDDPRSKPRKDKYFIFKEILNETDLKADQIWVIGDNPESEIKAAYKLGMKTIQRKSESKVKSEHTNYYIETFYELDKVITSTDK